MALLGGKSDHSSFRHEALLYSGEAGFLAGALPFVQDAVALSQPVLAAVTRPRWEVLAAALGSAAAGVTFVDVADLGGNPARLIPSWLAFVEEHNDDDGGRPVRVLGEPQWPGRRPEETVECQLHEGLLNLAVDPDLPLWLRCPYDVSALAKPVIEAALRSHPAVVEHGGYRGSTSYGGLHHVNSVFRTELPAAPSDSARLAFAGADLADLRRHVERCALVAGLPAERARSLTHAVAEIAANSVRHGGGKGELLTWLQPGALVCEISDPGRLGNPLAGRRAPQPEEEKGRGLWLANQVSDLVQIRSTPKGTAVRVFAWL